MWGGLKIALAFAAAMGIALHPASSVQALEKNKNKASAVSKSRTGSAAAQKKVSQKKKAASSNPLRTANVVRSRESQRLAIQSSSALVIEQGGGGALYQKNAHAVVPIASITKLMTAMVVLDGTPDLQASISISDEDVDYLRGSRSRLHVGTLMTRETALLLALMSSENRAAHALARHYPGGKPAFLAAMNIKAQSLGMLDTHFDDPTGLASSNVSTALDLAKMVSAAYRYPLIREFSTTPAATVEVDGQHLAFNNTNPLVKNTSWDVGLSKTGYIHEAGKCLVMQARLADKPVVIVLLDSAGKLTRVGDANRIKRWMENIHAMRKTPTQASTVSYEPVHTPG